MGNSFIKNLKNCKMNKNLKINNKYCRVIYAERILAH